MNWNSPELPNNPYYQDDAVVIYHADCRDIRLSGIDALITDPPYELGFMGKEWDKKGISFKPETWKLLLDACKPGAHLLAFGGTRTTHRIAVAIEDAGWEIRDTVMWVYGQGFPKSLDVSKTIDKMAGVKREDKFEGSFERHAGPTGNKRCPKCGRWLVSGSPCRCPRPQDAAVTLEAKQWEGWGTGLKPAWEPIILARKPLEGTVTQNVLKYGTGAINIDESRIPFPDADDALEKGLARAKTPRADIRGGGFHTGTDWGVKRHIVASGMTSQGRFPANLIHDGSDEVLAEFAKAGTLKSGSNCIRQKEGFFGEHGGLGKKGDIQITYGDIGTAARFFYCAKASRAERDMGLDGVEGEQMDITRKEGNPGGDNPRNRGVHKRTNNHPTVKPLALMRYLIKLITPPNGVILDPFMGSGSTLVAARQLGFSAIGIEIEERSCEIAVKRCGQTVMRFDT